MIDPPVKLLILLVSAPPEPIPLSDQALQEVKRHLAERSRPFIESSQDFKSRFESAMSSMRESVKSTLMDDLVSSQRLSECLRHLELANCGQGRGFEEGPGFDARRGTCASDFQFTVPKVYECGYCFASFLHVRLYLKHIRRHTDILKCDACNQPQFSRRNQ